MKKLQKIVICEDHPIYAKGMEDFLQNHFEVVGNFDSGRELLNFLSQNSTDLLLLDLNLVDINGVEVVQELKKKSINVKIVVISMYNDKMLIEKCEKIGVNAYCSKHIVNAELLEILNSVNENEFIVDESIKEKLNSKKNTSIKEDFEKKLNLTTRERELIKLFSKGLTSKEIANELFVSSFTIDTHKKNIYKKLNISSMAELVTFYYENL